MLRFETVGLSDYSAARLIISTKIENSMEEIQSIVTSIPPSAPLKTSNKRTSRGFVKFVHSRLGIEQFHFILDSVMQVPRRLGFAS